MKSISFLFFFLIFNINLFANFSISNILTGTDNIESYSSVIDNQGNIYILGSFKGQIPALSLTSYNNSADIFLAKFNSQLQLQWFKQIGSTTAELASGLALTTNDSIIIYGRIGANCYFESDTLYSTGSNDAFIAKFSAANGSYSWSKLVGYNLASQISRDITIDNNNNIILIGAFKDSISIGDTVLYSKVNTFNNFISKLDRYGNLIWTKLIKTEQNFSRILAVSAFDDGYYYSGTFDDEVYFDVDTLTKNYSAGAYDIFLYKTSFDGVGQWVRRSYGGTANMSATKMTQDEYGNVYFSGYNSNPSLTVDLNEFEISEDTIYNIAGQDIFICKYNKNGNLQWLKSIGGNGNEYTLDLKHFNNFIYNTGYFSGSLNYGSDLLVSSGTGDEDAFIGIIDLDGNFLNATGIDGSDGNDDWAKTIVGTENNEMYISGFFKSATITIGDSMHTNPSTGIKQLFISKYQPPFSIAFTEKINNECYGDSAGSLVVTPYYGVPPYTYEWSHTDTLNNDTAINLPVGTYTLTVTDSRDSSDTEQITITQPNRIQTTAVIDSVEDCYGDQTGAIDISVSGGTLPYSYAWSSDAPGVVLSTQDQTNVGAGVFNLTITDDNSCTHDTSYTVYQPEQIHFTGTSMTPITELQTGSIDLVVSGGTGNFVNYDWTGPEGYLSSDDSIDSLTLSGNYTVTVTDDSTCNADTTIFLVDSTKLNIFFEPENITHISCYGDSNGQAKITVIGDTGTISFSWSHDTLLNDSVATNLAAGWYWVTVTQVGDTAITDSIEITEPDSLIITLVNDNDTINCYGKSTGFLDISVSGGTTPYSYLWSNSKTTQDITGLAANTYNLTVTDNKSCTAEFSHDIVQRNRLEAIITETKSITCYDVLDGELTVAVTDSGGAKSLSYLWNDPGTQTTPVATGLGERSYQVTVTNSFGCNRNFSKSIFEPPLLAINTLDYTDVETCFGDSSGNIQITGTGGTGDITFSVNGGSTYQDSGIFNNLPSGAYTIVVKDSNNCTTDDSIVNLTQPTLLKIDSISTTHITKCYGDATGSITIYASGGTGTKLYSIDNGENYTLNNVFSNLSADTYNIKVRDGNSCEADTAPITLTEPLELTIDSTNYTEINGCYGDSTGEIYIYTSGGTGSLSYSIDDGLNYETFSSFTNLTAGQYDIKVRDDSACLDSVSPIVLNQPIELIIDTEDSTDVSGCYGNENGSIIILASGGTGAKEYSIDSGSTYQPSGIFNNLAAGTYQVVVRDQNLCETYGSEITLEQPAELIIDSIDSTDITGCYGDANGQIQLFASGGTGTIQYSINNGSNYFTDSIFPGLTAGIYMVNVKDANNCVSLSDTVELNEPAELTITNLDTTRVTGCYGNTNGTITISAAGGTG
ncbi:SprB repeat-containing protein, partial [Bacteroidota bacterium]